jgi:hypothetical protein
MVICCRGPFPLADFMRRQESDFGFINKGYITDDPALIDYISAQVIPAVVDGESSWIMTPTIGKCLRKAFVSDSPLAVSAPRQLLAEIADGLRSIFLGNPYVVRYLEALRVAHGRKPSDKVHLRAFEDHWNLQRYLTLSGKQSITTDVELDDWLVRRYGPIGFDWLRTLHLQVSDSLVAPVHWPALFNADVDMVGSMNVG